MLVSAACDETVLAMCGDSKLQHATACESAEHWTACACRGGLNWEAVAAMVKTKSVAQVCIADACKYTFLCPNAAALSFPVHVLAEQLCNHILIASCLCHMND